MSTAPLSQTLHLSPLNFTTLQTKNTSHKSRLFIPHHYTSHHFTYLNSPLTWIPLLVTTFLTLFLKVLSLQGKDASRLAGNLFQFVMVLFTKEYLPTSDRALLIYSFKYDKQDATFYNILYYCLCSTCFGRFLRPSSGAQELYTQHLGRARLACCYR